MIWWRVELHADGSVKSCREIEPVRTRSRGHVRIVEAPTKAAACSAAVQWLERCREVERARDKRRRERATKHNLCTRCRSRPATIGKSCARCIANRNDGRELRGPVKRRSVTPEQYQAEYLEVRRERNRVRRDQVRAALGVSVDTSVIAHLKALYDALGAEAFRAKLCEVVPDEISEAAE